MIEIRKGLWIVQNPLIGSIDFICKAFFQTVPFAAAKEIRNLVVGQLSIQAFESRPLVQLGTFSSIERIFRFLSICGLIVFWSREPKKYSISNPNSRAFAS